MTNKDIDTIWHERKLYKPENAEHIEKFVEEFSDVDFYIEAANRTGFRYIHKIGDDETKTNLSDELVMVENKDMITFYSEKTRLQSSYWIMKRRAGCFELFRGYYPPMFLAEEQEAQSAITQMVARIRGKWTLPSVSMRELLDFEGSETNPFIVDTPFSPAELSNKTPFGMRWGGEVITLTLEHLEALKNGHYIAIDVEREYVAFLKLDFKEGVDNGS